MACYGAAGYTWGATVGATAPASIVACNSAFGAGPAETVVKRMARATIRTRASLMRIVA
jgi:hypothetical protein